MMVTKIIVTISLCVSAIFTGRYFIYDGILWVRRFFSNYDFLLLFYGLMKIIVSPVIHILVSWGFMIVLSVIYGFIRGMGELFDNKN